MIKIIYETLADLSTFAILLLVFIFTFILIGMEWFAYTLRYNSDGEVDLENGDFPDANFNTFYQSFFIVFEVLTVDGWSDKFFRYFRHTNSFLSTIYFLSLIILG